MYCLPRAVVEVRVPRGPGAVEGKGQLLVVLVFLTPHPEGSEHFDLGRKQESGTQTNSHSPPLPNIYTPTQERQRVTTLAVSALATDNTGFCFRECAALACAFAAMVPDEALRLFEGTRHRNSPILLTYPRAFCVTCAHFPRAAPEARRPRT